MEPEPWWPSPYGPNDQIGRLNEITPNGVLAAVRLVRSGKVLDLGHILDEDVPAFPGRSFRQHLTTNARFLNLRRPDAGREGWGENNVNWIVEIVTATSQMGTHLDGLNHLQIGERCYNGLPVSQIAEEWGTNRLGIETVPQVLTRGLLVNVARLRGVDHLAPGEIVNPSDLQGCLDQAGLQIGNGDALLFHTGWSRLWNDHAVYLAGEPGPGLELANRLVEAGVVLTGCDTWSYGPVPPEDPRCPFIVPQTLNVKHGLFILENLNTAPLVQEMGEALACEFLFVLTHARVRGATAAWVSPVAVV